MVHKAFKRVAVVVIMGLCLLATSKTSRSSAQEQPAPNAKPAAGAVLLAECLPLLVEKHAVINETKHVESLRHLTKLFTAYAEEGLVDPTDLHELNIKFTQARIGLLRQEKAYLNLLDQQRLRVKFEDQDLAEIEKRMVLSLLNSIDRFGSTSTDFLKLKEDVRALTSLNTADEVRAQARRLIATSNLTKDTRAGKIGLERWTALDKISTEDIEKRRLEFERERMQLVNKQSRDRKAFPANDEKRLNQVETESNVRLFERELRTRWDRIDLRTSHLRFIELMLNEAHGESLSQARKSWPKMPPLKLNDLDLLTCEWSKAETALAAKLKDRETLAAVRMKLRDARCAYEAYGLEQAVFDQSQQQVTAASLRVMLSRSIASKAKDRFPFVDRKNLSSDRDIINMMNAELAQKEPRNQILRTWVDYQLVRMRLCQDLGIPQ